MNLYEALKEGKTEKELQEVFKKEIAEAVKRIKDEETAKAAADKKNLEVKIARDNVAAAIDHYIKLAYSDYDIEVNKDDILKSVDSMDRNLQSYLKIGKDSRGTNTLFKLLFY